VKKKVEKRSKKLSHIKGKKVKITIERKKKIEWERAEIKQQKINLAFS
jgi:hypothetical protein